MTREHGAQKESTLRIETRDRIIVAGLGNPGDKYRDTRHNIGSMVVNELANQWSIPMTRRRFDSFYGDGRVGDRSVVLLAPQTYMNLSGRAVGAACRFFNLDEEALVVIHDEIELPFGRVRAKWAGGNAGHNGLRSIDDSLGAQDYYRIRMGVGRPTFGSVTDHVLSRFDNGERIGLGDVVEGGATAVKVLLEKGLRAAQNEINGSVFFAVEPPDNETDSSNDAAVGKKITTSR